MFVGGRYLRCLIIACYILNLALGYGHIPQLIKPPRPLQFSLAATLTVPEPIYQVMFSPHGQIIAVLTGGTLTLRRAVDFKILRTFTDIGPFAFSPNSRLLATGGWTSTDSTIRIWRVKDGRLLRRLSLPNVWSNGLAFSPNGQTLLSVGGQKITSWRVADWRRMWSIQEPDSTVGIRSVRFSPKGGLFVTGDDRGSVKLWRTRDHKLIYVFPHQACCDGLIAFTPNSRFLITTPEVTATLSSTTLNIWRVRDGRLTRKISPTSEEISTFGLRPGGDIVGVGTVQGRTLLWGVRDNRLVQILPQQPQVMNVVVFSPTGHTLITASGDGTMKIWHER